MVFGRAPPPPPPPPFVELSVVEAFGWHPWLVELSVGEVYLLTALLCLLGAVHLVGRVTPMQKKATLNLKALNKCNVFKEVFLAYVNAGMLEPILAIASSDYDVSTKSMIINLSQLFGLFSWLYLLTDAFDASDTQQAYIYWDRLSKRGAVTTFPPWYKRAKGESAHDEGAELSGSLTRDLALWFMLTCSALAFTGVVSHRDVIHSHAILLLWLVMHHQARAATAWRGTGYLHTLLAPSTALLPLEFCLNLLDPEHLDHESGLDDLNAWRTFIQAESGVELDIEA